MYSVLSPEERKTLRLERVQTLEAEHYRKCLQIEELEAVSGENAATRNIELHAELTELQRRITMHTSHLGLETESVPIPDTAGNEDTSGNDQR